MITISDADLEEQALAAEPVDRVDDDVASWWDVVPRQDLDLLPDWYMPTPAAGAVRLTGWRRGLAVAMIGTFLSIDAAGLCFTYGAIT